MRIPRDLNAQELTELLHKTTPLPTLALETTSWNLIRTSGRSVRTADTKPKPLSLHSSRPGSEQKEFDSFVIITYR